MGKNETIHGSAQVCVVPAKLEHLAAIVACHKAALPGELTTLLGPHFLRKMYNFFIEQPEGICLVAVKYNKNCLYGVLIGGDPRLRRCYLLRNSISLIITTLYKGVCYSHVRKRLMQISHTYLQKLSQAIHVPFCKSSHLNPPGQLWGKWYLLQSISVHPDFQRQGVGSALIKAFQLESAQRGCGMISLTVASRNIGAIHLYKKLGWKNLGTDGTLVHFHRIVEHPA